MSYESILYDVDEGIATVILNRPETLNAMTDTMQQEVVEAIQQAQGADSVKVLVVTGQGRAFCAGANPRRLADRGERVVTGNPLG
ncbi:MAG: enoyl-CoA hydratase/isomerase family protein, partial [Chloroflexi bacterium]|nr:enoyl-CoA hydratase/isomerase family protein [Chloroflexota bacterium]